MAIETEVKIYISDLDTIRTRLESQGAELAKPRVFERNIRYENEDASLANNGIVLRLRQDSRVRLTYKEPMLAQASTGTISRVEFETEVSDFDTMHTILNRLGFHQSLIYEKYRTTYHWQDAEIVLDEMPYGYFIEIEGDAETINQIVDQLGLSNSPRLLASYIGIFGHVKSALGLSFTDLTFENFASVQVPPNLFDSLNR